MLLIGHHFSTEKLFFQHFKIEKYLYLSVLQRPQSHQVN